MRVKRFMERVSEKPVATRSPSKNGASLSVGGKSARVGRVQRQVRRAFIATNGRPIQIGDLLPRAFPQAKTYARWMRKSVQRAIPKFGVSLGRINARGRPSLYAPKPELARLIRGNP